jgi:penicillin amidase
MNLSRSIMRLLLGKRLPVYSGELAVPGIEGEIEISRDQYGIPYVEAKNALDAWFGLGFCHGQDRSFQLEMLLRLTRGSVAALVGEQGLEIDTLSRRFGFHRAAAAQLAQMRDEDKRMLSAYAAGIHAGATAGSKKAAHEFVLLRGRPTPWEAVDVLAGLNFVALALSAFAGKIARMLIMMKDGAEAVRALDDAYQSWLPVTSPAGQMAGAALDRLGEDLAQLTKVLGPGGASNNWALAASRTKSGRPIMANDPHLAPTVPAPWYLVQLRTPEWGLAGASFIGAPLIPSGHNGVAAWGVTAGLADNIDLYLEQIGEDGRSVRDGDQYVPCEILRERIEVKGKADVVEEILVTPRGPIISPVLDGVEVALSFKAIWMVPGQQNNLAGYHRAERFEAFRQGMTAVSGASLNMVYADEAGELGWQLSGNVPRRKKGWGTVPLPGWEPDYQWDPVPISGDELPHLRDPATGFVATANNKPAADGEGAYLGIDFADGYRLARIVGQLEGRRDWDLAACMALQTDQVTLAWRDMREGVLAALDGSDGGQEALDMLQAWDGAVASDSAAATVYEFFVAELASRLASVKAPKTSDWALGRGFHPLMPSSFFSLQRVSQLVRLIREQPEGWLPEPWPEEIKNGMARAISKVRRSRGPDAKEWAWGEVRPLTLLHSLATQKPLDKIFNLGPFPWGGDGQTVAQTARDLNDLSANPGTIANLRMVIDVGNWDENRFVLAGGQSGNPFSPHYADLLKLWQRGEGVPIAWSREAVAKAGVQRLRLTPSG